MTRAVKKTRIERLALTNTLDSRRTSPTARKTATVPQQHPQTRRHPPSPSPRLPPTSSIRPSTHPLPRSKSQTRTAARSIALTTPVSLSHDVSHLLLRSRLLQPILLPPGHPLRPALLAPLLPFTMIVTHCVHFMAAEVWPMFSYTAAWEASVDPITFLLPYSYASTVWSFLFQWVTAADPIVFPKM